MDIGTNTLNRKSVKVRSGLYVLRNTYDTFESQFMKKLSNTEFEHEVIIAE